MRKLPSRGFTIVELLIATVTFSVILLVITTAIIQFSKVYYKGVATSKTQEVALSIADEMSRSAQFSTEFRQNPSVYCFGDKRYRYTIDQIFSPTQPVMRVDTSPACDLTTPGLDTARGLVGENMRLLRLNASQVGDVITIEVIIGYGEQATLAGCPAISIGGQFCAVSTVRSTVTRRL